MQLRLFAILGIACLLAACGGGGGGGGGSGGDGPQAGSSDRVSLTATASTTPVPSATNTDLEFLVANPGTSTANDVALTVTLGAGLTNAGVECSELGGATCPSEPRTMRVATLPAGTSLRFRMSVVPAAGTSGTIASTATVTATNDQVTSNNSAQVSITAYSADVRVIGSTSASEFSSGSSVPYSITVSNAGPDAARDVVLENLLSSGQTLTTMDCIGTGGAICPASTGARMTIPSLPAGGSLTFAVTAQLSADVLVSMSNTLRAESLGDRDFANNTANISARTRIPTSPNSPSFVMLQSDEGDYIGAGRHYSYTQANAVFEVYEIDGTLTFRIRGDESWNATFHMPDGMEQLQAGAYTDHLGAPSHDPAAGGLHWHGEARSCGHSGWFQVDGVSYVAGQLSSLDLRFEQRCEPRAPALRGQIHWVANDATRPPGPVNPPPAGLWAPPAGATPESGNYVYLESDSGDHIGQGRTETYTQANAILSATESSGSLGINVGSDRNYGGGFRVMAPLTQMEPGYYPNAQEWSGNPTEAGLNFGGDGRSCNSSSGWFVIDSIAFLDGALTAVDMRFEQHCGNDTAALRGRIHWRSDDPTQPPGPQMPPPAGLWVPPAGAVPATGNVVYLESDVGDYVGQGLTKAYTPLDSVIDVGGGGMIPVGNRFQLTVNGDEEWTGFFQAMNTLPDLLPGYYGDLLGFPGHNRVRGGISWYGEGRGCNQATGWFVIDSVMYSGSTLNSIELRFEQHCEGQTPALRGLIRWSAADTRQPLPPQNPPPAGLWAPPSGAMPPAGNYVYLQSDAGDYVGEGQTHLYTAPDVVLLMSTSGSQLDVEVQGDVRWGGYFIPMVPLSQLHVGYYGGLTDKNPARGLLAWYGDGRACSDSRGWFVVDQVMFEAGSLTAIDLRFEQHCGAATPALRGKIHWRFDNPI
jgi:uncharacterized repeat protein (TIGR01451 family)